MMATGDQTGRGKARLANGFYVIYGNNVLSAAQLLDVSLIGIRRRNGAPSRKGCVVNGLILRQATNEYAPPPSP